MAELVLASLAGGLNDSDPPIALDDDQCVLAENVEFHRAPLGERRRGTQQIDLTNSPLAVCDRVVWMHRHLPTTDPAEAQFWALGIIDPSTAVLAYKDTSWHTVTMSDAPIIDGVSEYRVRSVTLHGKLFVAYKSAVNRLHVWDGTTFRRVGLVAPTVAPTVVDSGSGTFGSTRYYRTREIVRSGSTTTRRSEPSDSLTFTPSGSGSGATLTKPATSNSDATHWEAEASLDNANFYVIATVVIGTTTTVDTTAASDGYGSFELSEDIGSYEVPHSARLLMADEDRLILMGSHEDAGLESSVSWTPVYNNTGVGNDERIVLDPVSVVNLDGFEGGSISDCGRWAQGEIGAFKDEHVYKLIRTGQRQRAYEAYAVSKTIGAIPGSVVEGVDASGNAALYFLDPSVGPYRFTVQGALQYAGHDVWETWDSVNLDATHAIARSFYDPTRRQVHWRIATDTATVPSLGLVIQTDAMRTSDGGDARRGFSTVTGDAAGALACCLYSDNIDDGLDRSRVLVPYMAVEGNGLIWRCDVGATDNGTPYAARIRTKPYAPTKLQTQFEVKAASLVAKAVEDASLSVSIIPDGGVTTTELGEDLDFTPSGSETFVIRTQDDLAIAEMTTMQFEFADTDTPGGRWELARFSTTVTIGQGS